MKIDPKDTQKRKIRRAEVYPEHFTFEDIKKDLLSWDMDYVRKFKKVVLMKNDKV